MYKTAITAMDIDLSCEDIFYNLYTGIENDYFCFLDSSLLPNKYSNFSYIAWEPEFAIRGYGYNNELINCSDKNSKSYVAHPLKFLKNIFAGYVSYNDHGKSLVTAGGIKKIKILPDFCGGFIGYLSYDLKNFIEALPDTVKDDIKLPLYYLIYYPKLLAYGHMEKRWYFITRVGYGKKGDIENIVGAEKERVMDIIKSVMALKKKTGISVNKKIKEKYLKRNIEGIDLKSNFFKKDYIKAVKRAKQYIHDGDIYQVNMTQRFSCQFDIEPVDVYYVLRQKNPAPFSAFLDFSEFQIGSSSPERFLFLKNGIIETRPIKGTRPRGGNKREEKRYYQQLKNSIKDRAELNMIVDLERNDLGKFSKYGSVRVEEHAVIEKYARVIHLVSTVVGIVKDGYDIADIIKATFPGGSITGAPKIRAMQIIDELEPTVRSVYTGAIGYIGVDGTMDINIVIRTFIIKNKVFYYNVGGGIVEDSKPEEEYQETLDKGLALKETLEFFKRKNLLNLV